MKAITHYSFEDGDCPSPNEIRESFNLLYEFCPALREEEHPVCKAFHCVVDNKEFTEDKWRVLNDFGLMVARHAEEKYSLSQWESAPWRDSIMQNAARLRGVMVGLENMVKGVAR